MKPGIRKPSPALVVACLALLVALSGASYAAITLPRNSVGTPQLKKNAVVSVKVKNRSLKALAFAAGQLPAGPQGLQGAPGRSALEPLRSGEMIRGVIGGAFKATAVSDDFRVLAAFPIPAPAPVSGANVDIDESEADETSNRCTGSATSPTAPAGVVCIYILGRVNSAGWLGTGAPDPVAGSAYGFGLGWDATGAGATEVTATWAYRAP